MLELIQKLYKQYFTKSVSVPCTFRSLRIAIKMSFVMRYWLGKFVQQSLNAATWVIARDIKIGVYLQYIVHICISQSIGR